MVNKREEASEHYHPSLSLPKYECDMTSHPILLPPQHSQCHMCLAMMLVQKKKKNLITDRVIRVTERTNKICM